ncbi:MAG: riboflavin synthase [Helicobacter sp.]|nr:riboflavin synthase [Helicobacter sp.]
MFEGYMFSGLIREIGKIHGYSGSKIQVACIYKPDIGDSIAVNGVCLTAISRETFGFSAELSMESKKSIALERFIPQSRVHIEPALQVNARLDGHIVQGHIDCIGTITQIIHTKEQSDFFIRLENTALDYVLPKGSVCVDGVSLTAGSKSVQGFGLTIIPHTLKNTLFKDYKVGMRVNIETDMFVRNAFSALKALVEKKDSTQYRLKWRDIDHIQMQF